MIDGFFDDCPGLGSVFDYDGDGNLDFDEAVAMGAMAAVFGEEFSDDDDDDDDDDEEANGFSFNYR